MADTNVRITLDIVDSAAQSALSNLIGQTAQADSGFQKLGGSGSGTFNEIALNIGKASGVFEIFEGNLLANLATEGINLLAEAAHALFDIFVVEGVKAAADQQTAINQLNQAMAASGQYTKEASDGFVQFAEGLEKTSTFESTAILKGAALLESLTQLDQQGLQRATQAALDMSAATGKDLTSSFQAVAKAAEGNVNSLHRFGVEVQKGYNDSQTFDNALTALEAHFGGAAAAQVNTYSGAIAQSGNAFTDLTRQIGDVIVQNPVVIESIKAVTVVIEELAADAKSAGPSLKETLGQSIIYIIQSAAYLTETFDIVVRSGSAFYNGLKLVFDAIGATVTGVLSIFSTSAKTAFEQFQAEANKAAAGVNAAFGGQTTLNKMADSLNDIGHAAEGGFVKLQAGANGSVEPINNTATAVTKLNAEQQKALDTLKAFTEQLVKQSTDAKLAATQTLEVEKATDAAELASYQQLLARKQIDNVQYAQKKQQLDKQQEAVASTALDKEYAADKAKLDAYYASGQESEEQYQIAVTQLNQNYQIKRDTLNAQSIQKQIQDETALEKAKEQLLEQNLQYASDFFGNLSSLTKTKNKELFEIGKAASIAHATVNVFEAITKTMAAVPYPVNIPLAIAQGIAGAVEIANIAGTQPSFEAGGIVQGSSYTGDNVTANVNSGEMILNNAQQAQLFKMANGQSSGMDLSVIAQKLDVVVQAILATPVNVNIGGKAITDTIRSQLRAGRTFAT